MPLYTANTQEGTVSVETKAENCRRDYPNPHQRDEGSDELLSAWSLLPPDTRGIFHSLTGIAN